MTTARQITAQQEAAARQAAKERAHALAFIPALRTWPRWPYLPMKRGPQSQELGYLYADNATDEDGVIVYVTAFYGEGKSRVVNKIKYNTVAECLDDGWRID